MTQDSLDFGRLYGVADSVRSTYRALNDAVDSVGGIVVAAGACGADRADLRRALDRDGRSVKVEWAIAIGSIATAEVRKRLGDSMLRSFDLVAQPAAPPLSDKEARARLEGALRALGPIGEQAADAALGGRR